MYYGSRQRHWYNRNQPINRPSASRSNPPTINTPHLQNALPTNQTPGFITVPPPTLNPFSYPPPISYNFEPPVSPIWNAQFTVPPPRYSPIPSTAVTGCPVINNYAQPSNMQFPARYPHTNFLPAQMNPHSPLNSNVPRQRFHGPPLGHNRNHHIPQAQFSCCDKYFFCQKSYDEHVKKHITCKLDGCTFSADHKLIENHIKMQHKNGLFQRIQSGNTREEIDKWIAERKKQYPTAAKVSEKKAMKEEMEKRGERYNDVNDGNKRFNYGSNKNSGLRNNYRRNSNNVHDTSNGYDRKNKHHRRNYRRTAEEEKENSQSANTSTPFSKHVKRRRTNDVILVDDECSRNLLPFQGIYSYTSEMIQSTGIREHALNTLDIQSDGNTSVEETLNKNDTLTTTHNSINTVLNTNVDIDESVTTNDQSHISVSNSSSGFWSSLDLLKGYESSENSSDSETESNVDKMSVETNGLPVEDSLPQKITLSSSQSHEYSNAAAIPDIIDDITIVVESNGEEKNTNIVDHGINVEYPIKSIALQPIDQPINGNKIDIVTIVDDSTPVECSAKNTANQSCNVSAHLNKNVLIDISDDNSDNDTPPQEFSSKYTFSLFDAESIHQNYCKDIPFPTQLFETDVEESSCGILPKKSSENILSESITEDVNRDQKKSIDISELSGSEIEKDTKTISNNLGNQHLNAGVDDTKTHINQNINAEHNEKNVKNGKGKKKTDERKRVVTYRRRFMPPTLLEKLLTPEIRHERNVILQCVRYAVNENYFGIINNDKI